MFYIPDENTNDPKT